MGTISVTSDFDRFCKNLRMSDTTVSNVQNRYHAITKRVNSDYWNSSSDTLHSLYVGSYGRGTSIYTSDIDIVVELPWSEYTRYNNYSGNGQSALLAALRNCLLKTYSSSSVSADGQVVDIAFSDGVKFEVVPAFKYSDGSGYCYPDTNNGGSWRSMNIVGKRDKLMSRTAKVYENAPQTDEKAYADAQDALKNKEEQFFTQEELNVMLPAHLRK